MSGVIIPYLMILIRGGLAEVHLIYPLYDCVRHMDWDDKRILHSRLFIRLPLLFGRGW